MDIKKLNQKLQRVPPQLIPEIMDYIDFLINKYGIDGSRSNTIRLNCNTKPWIGGNVSSRYKYFSGNIVESEEKIN
jgi:hypothetical protein